MSVREFLQRLRAAPAAAWLLPACIALLPFSRSYELPILVMAALGLRLLPGLLRGPFALDGQRIAAMCFLGYWLPELVSAIDSVAPSKSWTEVAADLRFLPMLLYAQQALARPGASALALGLLAALIALWCLDALVQAVAGVSLGGANTVDRLSGIFGDDNLKLGAVMAAVSPLLLLPLRQRFGWTAFALAAVALGAVILMAGARAAWASYALLLALMLWYALPRLWMRLAALGGSVMMLAVLGVLALQLSPRFAERIERTSAALAGDSEALDHALSYRLPIWRAALAMSAEHPLNGVGVRAYRYAYPQYAEADDRFLTESEGEQGAFHAHQLVLEILSETGAFGLLCWLTAALLAVRWARAQPAPERERAWPYSLALIALLFPLNTHYAVYSSFLSVLLFALIALWLGALSTSSRAAR
jgi:O-antigen ligase